MTGADFGGFILGLVVVAIVAAIVVWLFHWLYLRSSKERAFVRTGMGGQKVVMNGGAFVLPIVHDVIPVNMNTLRLEVSRGRDKALITRDRMRVDVVSEFYVRVQAAAAARNVRKDVIILCHGGPIATPADAAYILASCPDCHGFFGASSMERLPTEVAIAEQTRQFKRIERRREAARVGAP